MSLFSEGDNFNKININISFNMFTYLDKIYKLKFVKKLYNKNDVLIKLYKLYEYNEISNQYTFIKDVVRKILYKYIPPINNNYDETFYDEIRYNLYLKENMSNFRCNILYYYIRNIKLLNLIEYSMFFDYLGETLEKFNISNLNLSNKIHLIIDLLQQCIELNNLSLYHNDIKPDNICIQNREIQTQIQTQIQTDIQSINSPYQLSLIDYGLLYGEKEYNNMYEYNTTITSGSPEYYNINKVMENNSTIFPKDLFDKSQHFAVAGIIFGIIVDDSYLYFSELYKNIKKNHKYSTMNFDNCDILVRFSLYRDKALLNSMKQFILDKLNNINSLHSLCIKDIVFNMLHTDHNERLSFEEIKLFFENKLIELDKINN